MRHPPVASASCFGRENELTQLLARHRQAIERSSVLLSVVQGPTGMGKTKLLGALRAQARLAGEVVFEGRADAHHAFAPFAAIVRQALAFLDDCGVAFSRPALGCARGCHALWYEHLYDSPQVELGLSPGSQLRFFGAVAALLREVSRVQAPLLILHPLDQVDRGSLDLLEFLLDAAAAWAEASPPLAASIVSCVRSVAARGSACEPNGAPSSFERLEPLLRHEATQTLTLGALDEAGVRALLTAPESVARILKRTGGAPDAIERLLDPSPLSVHRDVHSALAKLPAADREALFALAFACSPASFEELEQVTAHTLTAAQRSTLAALPWLELRRDGEKAQLAFRRSCDTDSVASAGASSAARLHRAWLALRGVEQADPALCARHAAGAGEPQLAATLARSAARSLVARHAPQAAAELLEELLVRAPGVGESALRSELVALLRMTGDYRRALVHARALQARTPVEAREQRGQERGVARGQNEDLELSLSLCDLLLLAGQTAEAGPRLQEAHEAAELRGARAFAAEFAALLADNAVRRGDYAGARAWAERVLRPEADDTSRAAILARNALGKAHLARHEAGPADALFERNVAAARQRGARDLEAQALTNLGYARLDRRAPSPAGTLFEQALELAEQIGDTRRRAVAAEAIAICAHLARDYGKARTFYQEALQLLRRVSSPALTTGVAANLAELYLCLGDTKRAASLCELTAQLGNARLSPVLHAEHLLLRGRVARARHEIGAARAAFETARDALASQGDPRVCEAGLALCELDLHEGNIAVAAQRIAQLNAADGRPRAQLALLHARLERASGRGGSLQAERAVRLAEQSGDDELELASLVFWAQGLLAEAKPVAARGALERATAIEERLTSRVPVDLVEVFAERPQRLDLDAARRSLGTVAGQGRAHEPRVAHASPAELERWVTRYPEIAGRSQATSELLRLIDRAAHSELKVLIRGESGTGKELVAEAVHRHSARRAGPFVRVNCAAITESLLLSELFGHERGAFTGAAARHRGRFETAHGGTLFLDEIGDISPAAQAALLRVLAEGEFSRVGGVETLKVSVRVIAATHRDLEAMVQAGTFREDLYYRLRGLTIEVLPLRERHADIAPIAARLLSRLAGESGQARLRLTDDALHVLNGHRWPGNVRELDNVLRHASLFAEAGRISASALRGLWPASAGTPTLFCSRTDSGASISEAPGTPGAGSTMKDPIEPVYGHIRAGHSSLFEMKKQLERECIERALRETGGNITRAAALLGMKRPRLSQLVKEYELNSAGERP